MFELAILAEGKDNTFMQLPTIPEGLDLIESPFGTTIRKTWRSWMVFPLAVFAIFWDGFLFFFYSSLLTKAHSPGAVFMLFPIPHVCVGIGLTYYVLASLVNKTDFVISESGVTVTSGPAPWIGNCQVRADEIEQVMVRERRGNKGRRTYSVMYAGSSRKEKRLVSWLANQDQAEFIAETIRDILRLH